MPTITLVSQACEIGHVSAGAITIQHHAIAAESCSISVISADRTIVQSHVLVPEPCGFFNIVSNQQAIARIDLWREGTTFWVDTSVSSSERVRRAYGKLSIRLINDANVDPVYAYNPLQILGKQKRRITTGDIVISRKTLSDGSYADITVDYDEFNAILIRCMTVLAELKSTWDWYLSVIDDNIDQEAISDILKIVSNIESS